MNIKRRSGVLLHPTSFNGCAGIGTLGTNAYNFIDWLENAGQTLWQTLPLGPTGYGDSPYASFSTFAGNPLLIDIEILCEQGFLTREQLELPEYIWYDGNVDYSAVIYWKTPLLQLAAKQFLKNAKKAQLTEYKLFYTKHKNWLLEYATFMSIKNHYDKLAQEEHVEGAMWSNYWPKELALHKKDAVQKWQEEHTEEIESFAIIQYFFMNQWLDLKAYANKKGISIIGDIPIFVASDSADVWANQELFQLDKTGRPKAVAGVPPDYFSKTGQMWGNPLYDWKKMKKDDYAWWIERIKHALTLSDIIRIDHFRGFEAYWAIPVGEETAVNGKWEKGPYQDLFDCIKEKLGSDLPLIAEDLGVITERVEKLRDDNNFPGMKVLQFAFDMGEYNNGSLENYFLPHTYDTSNCVVYTGTHDNETLQGWINSLSAEEKSVLMRYLGECAEHQIAAELIRLAFSSIAGFAIIPMQDFFNIGSEGRMNFPSKIGGINWQWRMSREHLSEEKADWLRTLNILYGRN